MDLLFQQSSLIKAEARQLGFDGCGISEAGLLATDAEYLKNWINNGYSGEMHYMTHRIDVRVDPTRLFDSARSVISVLLNYYTHRKQADAQAPQLSKYAYGEDYHDVIQTKLKRLLQYIHDNITPVQGKIFVDSAPVLDKAWAAKGGLGWIGKNSILVNPGKGSYFFIGTLIVDIPLSYDKPIRDYCGSCNRCIEACPTKAIIAPHVVDARKCISYLTVESKGAIDRGYHEKFGNRVFGCDTCQDVCPWNRKSSPHGVKEFQPSTGLMEMSRQDWLTIDEKRFNELFSKSSVKRIKFSRLKRNLEFIS
jgi:epoxyqueuosine reductase